MTLCEPAARAVRIRNRAIGPDEKVYIVAEAGVNHDGALRKAIELVDAAAEAGADAVKFQAFRAEQLTTADAPLADYQRSGGSVSQQRMLQRLELDDADFERIRARCIERGIEFLATPFGVDDVARLERIGIAAIKLASSDLNNSQLIERAAQSGLPLILSTGASTADEIRDAVAHLDSIGARDRAILLHCVSRYPTPVEDANLRTIRALIDAFGLPAGFSDHTESTYIGGWAVAGGACLLEKHMTLDPSGAGPDHAMSLDPTEFAAYVASVRQIERVLGKAEIGMQDSEAEVRRVARKSIVARRPLRAGEVITPDALTLKRPGTGIAPSAIDRLLGRRMAVDAAADTLLTWEMIA